MIRVIFPLLLRKDGQPRKRQPPARVTMNGRQVIVARGKVVDLPAWVAELCASCTYPEYECFVSVKTPWKKGTP